MDIAAFPRYFPQFGKSIWNVARPMARPGGSCCGSCDTSGLADSCSRDALGDPGKHARKHLLHVIAEAAYDPEPPHYNTSLAWARPSLRDVTAFLDHLWPRAHIGTSAISAALSIIGSTKARLPALQIMDLLKRCDGSFAATSSTSPSMPEVDFRRLGARRPGKYDINVLLGAMDALQGGTHNLGGVGNRASRFTRAGGRRTRNGGRALRSSSSLFDAVLEEVQAYDDMILLQDDHSDIRRPGMGSDDCTQIAYPDPRCRGFEHVGKKVGTGGRIAPNMSCESVKNQCGTGLRALRDRTILKHCYPTTWEGDYLPVRARMRRSQRFHKVCACKCFDPDTWVPPVTVTVRVKDPVPEPVKPPPVSTTEVILVAVAIVGLVVLTRVPPHVWGRLWQLFRVTLVPAGVVAATAPGHSARIGSMATTV